jgi:holin-like protein
LIRFILLLLGFQLAGELISRGFSLLVPGNVIGMAMLFMVLIWRGRVSADVDGRVRRFLKPLPLYFVPASVGLVTFIPLLAAEGVGIVLTMILSTAVTMWVVAVLLDKWLHKRA